MSVLDLLVPTKRRRAIFGADSGRGYGGDTKALFRAMLEEGTWDCRWMCSDISVAAQVEAEFPGKVALFGSRQGLLFALGSSVRFVTHGPPDLGPLGLSLRRRLVYMNHGTPLKTMGFARRSRRVGPFRLPEMSDRIVRRIVRRYAAFVCASPVEAELWHRAWRAPLDRMWITGHPRNVDLALAATDRSVSSRQVLYAPTYRDWGVLPNFMPVPGTHPADLVELLDEHDAVLLIRPHYFESDAAAKFVSEVGSDRVQLADSAIYRDVQDLLLDVDILVTDYSSIYFDFLVTNRPMIFTPYDLERYERERGFLMDYADNVAGAVARTPSEFLKALEAELRGDDPFAEQRVLVRNRFHTAPPQNANDAVIARAATMSA